MLRKNCILLPPPKKREKNWRTQSSINSAPVLEKNDGCVSAPGLCAHLPRRGHRPGRAAEQEAVRCLKKWTAAEILWMDRILHLTNPGMMVPLRMNGCNPGFKAVQNGSRGQNVQHFMVHLGRTCGITKCLTQCRILTTAGRQMVPLYVSYVCSGEQVPKFGKSVFVLFLRVPMSLLRTSRICTRQD